MSHEIPVFTSCVDFEKVRNRSLTEANALALIEENPWTSTSRNWWYQGIVADLLRAYPGFDRLNYLIEVVAVVAPEDLQPCADAIHKLIASIGDDPTPMMDVSTWYGASADEIRKHIKEAKVLRNLDDDSLYAFSNFFSFLVSHAAALHEASRGGKAILYVQPQP